MKKNIGLSPLVALMILSGGFMVAGCDNKQPQQGHNSTPSVGVVTLKAEPLAITTELPGRTAPYRIAEVRPQVSGIILSRNFVEGAEIQAGVSLYQIDPASYQAAYESAKGELAKAEAAEEIARLTVERYRPLRGSNYVSKQDYDTASSLLMQAKAAVLAAKAAVESARINLAYTKVTSPISGRIGVSAVSEGALVTSGQPAPLSTVQQLDPMFVDIKQSASDYLRLKQALTDGSLVQQNGKIQVKLLLDNQQEYAQAGTLEFSDLTVDQTTGAITLRAVFPNPDKQLLPGMFVRARLNQGEKPDAVLVPQQGVTRNPRGEATALVVGADDKVELRVLQADQTVGNQWLVTAGVKAGDRVIVSGLQRVRPGASVKASEIDLNAPAQSQPASSAAQKR
ncbi:efflux RND transporter periplasmic adaptor subunit [Serratia microhaemolytica]|uniref:efflux RND transporter periplasmic adaptor subunit n=1 Tax=Serratia microhaemolytica TaxID=2675110 RepID=UPI000FDF17B6|nr:efflux RND transporter periplasmic adaptor subunit [Serratia microhaemolytica]